MRAVLTMVRLPWMSGGDWGGEERDSGQAGHRQIWWYLRCSPQLQHSPADDDRKSINTFLSDIQLPNNLHNLSSPSRGINLHDISRVKLGVKLAPNPNYYNVACVLERRKMRQGNYASLGVWSVLTRAAGIMMDLVTEYRTQHHTRTTSERE